MLINFIIVYMNLKFMMFLEEGKLGLFFFDYLVIREVWFFDRICFGD